MAFLFLTWRMTPKAIVVICIGTDNFNEIHFASGPYEARLLPQTRQNWYAPPPPPPQEMSKSISSEQLF